MRNLLCILLLSFSSLFASAQKIYFIYLQTENNTPFYIKMGDEIYSSAASGYYILSNLIDSTYNFSVGLPSMRSEARFSVPVNGKDHGFLIKNLSSGISLFDLQSLSIIHEQKDQLKDDVFYQKRNDEFALILSKAANDTSLLYAVIKKPTELPKESNLIKKTPSITEEKPKTQELITAMESVNKDSASPSAQTTNTTETKRNDTTAIVQTLPQNTKALDQQTADSTTTAKLSKTTTVDAQQNQGTAVSSTKDTSSNTVTATSAEVFKRSVVKKHSESSTSEGFGLVFYDLHNESTDTIQLIIPNPRFIIKQGATDSSQTTGFINRDELKNEKNTIVKLIPQKLTCKVIANNNDFLRLRKNMAARETDEAMVEEAKKAFKSKCFTVEQIKNLSTLFLTSAGKYQFFDAAYLHVTDQTQFFSLETEIKDDYYLKRFKALVGE